MEKRLDVLAGATLRTTAPKRAVGWLRLRPADVMLTAYVLWLATFSYVASTVALGGLPVAVLGIAVFSVIFARSVIDAFRKYLVVALSAATAAFLIALTVVRLFADVPTYGNLAIRDAVISVCFAAIPLGAAIVVKFGSDSVLHIVRGMCYFLAAYNVVFILSPVLSFEFFGSTHFQNVAVASVALVSAGLWGSGKAFRFTCLAAGSAGLVVTQSRMLLLVAGLIVVYYLAAGQVRASRNSFVGRSAVILALAGAAALILIALSSAPQLTGRVGDISIATLGDLVASVFDDSSTLSGSRQDRERWWSDIWASSTSSPDRLLLGIGLGPDLLNGFLSRDGTLVRKPHNDFLEAFARLGIAAALALIALLVLPLIRITRLLRSDGSWGPLFGWYIAGIASALTQPYLSYPHGAIPVAIIAGVALASPSTRSAD